MVRPVSSSLCVLEFDESSPLSLLAFLEIRFRVARDRFSVRYFDPKLPTGLEVSSLYPLSLTPPVPATTLASGSPFFRVGSRTRVLPLSRKTNHSHVSSGRLVSRTPTTPVTVLGCLGPLDTPFNLKSVSCYPIVIVRDSSSLNTKSSRETDDYTSSLPRPTSTLLTVRPSGSSFDCSIGPVLWYFVFDPLTRSPSPFPCLRSRHLPLPTVLNHY